MDEHEDIRCPHPTCTEDADECPRHAPGFHDPDPIYNEEGA